MSLWHARSFLAYLLALLPHEASASVLEGWLDTTKSFQYVGKFAFDYVNEPIMKTRVGNLTVNISCPQCYRGPNQAGVTFVMFDDQRDSWPMIREHYRSMTCEEVMENSKWNKTFPLKQNKDYHFRGILEHIHPRFWYFAFIKCGQNFDKGLHYTVHTENILNGWQSEVSFEQKDTFTIYGVSFLLFCLESCVHFMVVRGTLRQHPLLRLLMLSGLASTASCLLLFLHSYRQLDGIDNERLHFVGVFFSIVASTATFLLGVLAVQGWATSVHSISRPRVLLPAAMIIGAAVLSALMEIRSELIYDPSTKLYSYQSTPGMAVMVMKLFLFCWFGYLLQGTTRRERLPEAKRYYVWLACSLALWCLTVPFTVVMAFKLAPYCRFKVVAAIDLSARFIGLTILSCLLCGPASLITERTLFLPLGASGDQELTGPGGRTADGG